MRRAYRGGGSPRRLPPAPVNVRVVDVETGETFAVEMAYRGRKGGIDRWRATVDVTLWEDRSYVLRADELPGRCQIEVAVRRPEEPGGGGSWRLETDG